MRGLSCTQFLRQMAPVDALWAEPGWLCSDSLAPLLAFPGRYFSILVLINPCLKSLQLSVKEIAHGLDFHFLYGFICKVFCG